jgi:hypothetical protein
MREAGMLVILMGRFRKDAIEGDSGAMKHIKFHED